jgi:dihydroorotase
MIDPHVHLRDWEQKAKETIEHGLSVASNIGIHTVFDMPNTQPALTFPSVIVDRITYGTKIAQKIDSQLSYCVYGGLTTDESQIEVLTQLYTHLFPQLIGFKMFAGHSTGNMGIVSNYNQSEVYRVLKRAHYKGVLAVHCEQESLLRPELFSLSDPISHTLARPKEAEIASIENQIRLFQQHSFEGTLHICHISTKESIELVTYHKKRGMAITCGATAHHALLDEQVMNTEKLFAKMNPPLRTVEDRDAVFEALLDGRVDWIESDHAPHTIEDKEKGASGIPGFYGTLLLLQALRGAHISEEHLENLCGNNVNKTFNTSFLVDVPSPISISQELIKISNEYPFNPFLVLSH